MVLVIEWVSVKQERAHVLVLKVLIFKWVSIKIKEKLSKKNWVIKEKRKDAVIFRYRAKDFRRNG